MWDFFVPSHTEAWELSGFLDYQLRRTFDFKQCLQFDVDTNKMWNEKFVLGKKLKSMNMLIKLGVITVELLSPKTSITIKTFFFLRSQVTKHFIFKENILVQKFLIQRRFLIQQLLQLKIALLEKCTFQKSW